MNKLFSFPTCSGLGIHVLINKGEFKVGMANK